MQYTLTISQTKALEWGLNAQQAMLFAFVYECPSWCRPITNQDGVFYALSKAKIIEELPLLTDKPDTAYRLLKQLQEAGVIELSHTREITLVRVTDLGRTWNRREDGSEKYPSEVGKISELGRKNIRVRSEKSPTNQDTNNQDTNQETKSLSVDDAFALFWKASSGNGSKKKAREIFAAICKRESLEPMALATTLINDTNKRIAARQFGFDKLHITTYLNQERWNDKVLPSDNASPVNQPFESKVYVGTADADFAPDIFGDGQ